MNRSIRLDLPVLLPEVVDDQDACVARLVRSLEKQAGVVDVHVVRPGEALRSDEPPLDASPAPAAGASEAQLCLHYDAERLSLAKIEELARRAGAQLTERFGHLMIPIRVVGAEDEDRRIEAGLRRLPGVSAASVSLAGQVARVEYDRRRIAPDAIYAELTDLGARPSRDVSGDGERGGEAGGAAAARAAADSHAESAGTTWYTRNRELAWSIAAGVLALAGWLTERSGLPPAAAITLFMGAYFFGARDNVWHFVRDLTRGRFQFNIDLLMVVAALGAALLGEWFEGALLLFLFSLGHALEHYALGRARNAIKALAELAPTRAIVLREEGGVAREVTVAIEEVRRGDRVVVRPAERLPVDGTVREGQSGVNQAPITGESVPVDKAPGDPVFAGSVNGEGALVIEVTAALGDRTLDRVVKLVAEAQTQKAPTQQFTDRFERIFVPLVLVADLLLIVVPPLTGVWTWSEAFYRAMALLVAASPCALALGTPSAVLAGIAQAARRGVLIKGGAHLEALGAIRVLAVDKTGTITRGEPAVTDVVAAPGVTDDDLLATAAAVERRSQHPLARAVMAAAESRQLSIPEAGELQSVTGRGIRAPVGNRTVEVGRLLMFEERGMAVPEEIRGVVMRLEENGRSTMVVRSAITGDATAGNWLGVIGIADEPRANAATTIARLRKSGIERIVMLTGDNAGVGNAVGRTVGIDDVRAGLLPEDKVASIQELVATGPVAMVGDGVNDAPALATATVGIAMGGAGTAAALETADVALMSDDLSQLPFAIGLSHRARGVIRQNLYISMLVIAGLVVATVTGAAGIGLAVIVHEGSTLVVVANALRLLAYRGVEE